MVTLKVSLWDRYDYYHLQMRHPCSSKKSNLSSQSSWHSLDSDFSLSDSKACAFFFLCWTCTFYCFPRKTLDILHQYDLVFFKSARHLLILLLLPGMPSYPLCAWLMISALQPSALISSRLDSLLLKCFPYDSALTSVSSLEHHKHLFHCMVSTFIWYQHPISESCLR